MKNSFDVDAAAAAAQKSALRRVFYARRREALENDPQLNFRLGAVLVQWLETIFGNRESTCVGFYRPIRHEPDVTAALSAWAASASGRTLAVPVVDESAKGLMHYARWSPQMPMKAGAYGIAEPAVDERLEPDVIVSPCVAVTRAGMRLGNGGGYFDRYLALRQALGRTPAATVALALEATVIDEAANKAAEGGLAPQDFDIAFDWVATEAGVVRAGS